MGDAVKSWKLLAEGPFGRDDLRAEYRDEMRGLPPEIEAEIDAHWMRSKARARGNGVRLFDGGLLHVDNAREESGALYLDLSRTSYRRWIYAAGRRGGRQISRPMACCAAVVSSDGKILLQERSAEVAEGAGLLHVPGGHPDPARDLANGLPDLFSAMESELGEELSLEPGALDEGRILALIENVESGKPELLFRYCTRLSSREIARVARGGRDRYEFESLSFIDGQPEAIADFLAQNEMRLAVPSRALLEMMKRAGP